VGKGRGYCFFFPFALGVKGKEGKMEGLKRYGSSGGGNLDKGRKMGNINVNVRSLGVR
jgi:hypothetical protein